MFIKIKKLALFSWLNLQKIADIRSTTAEFFMKIVFFCKISSNRERKRIILYTYSKKMAEISNMDANSSGAMLENLDSKPSELPMDDGDVLLDYEAEEPDEIENPPVKDSDTENAENEPDFTKIDGRNAFISSVICQN